MAYSINHQRKQKQFEQFILWVYTVKYRFMESSLLLVSPLYLEISIPTDIQSIDLSYHATSVNTRNYLPS